MILRIVLALTVTAVIALLGYLNNEQTKQLAIHEHQLAEYSSLVSTMIDEQAVYDRKLTARDKVSEQFLETIKELNDEKSTLARDLANRTKRVYVKATCAPVSAASDSFPTSSHDAVLPELDPSAGLIYLDFREQYQLQYRAFRDLQDHVRTNCTSGVKKPPLQTPPSKQ